MWLGSLFQGYGDCGVVIAGCSSAYLIEVGRVSRRSPHIEITDC